jgi:hypothetical protein
MLLVVVNFTSSSFLSGLGSIRVVAFLGPRRLGILNAIVIVLFPVIVVITVRIVFLCVVVLFAVVSVHILSGPPAGRLWFALVVKLAVL